MGTKLTEADARESLNAHVEARGLAIRDTYGPSPGWEELHRILNDRSCVRYPCEIAFDAAPLQPGELAYPRPNGDTPAEGFTIFVHPFFKDRLDLVPSVVLYQLVAVNYGDFASPEDAETFGAAALGLGREEYYESLCTLADQLPSQ